MRKNNVKPKPFHFLIEISHYIFLSVFILLILHVNAHANMREVRVGVYANKPLVYQDESGEHKGLSIDVLRFVASKENWKLEFVPCSWSECLDMLKRGEIDIQVIIAKTPERDKIYDFTSQLLYSLWAQIFIHPDTDIESWTDLNGKNVAVHKDDLFSETFKKLIREFDIDCTLLEVESYQAMLKLMKEKKADAGVFIQTFAEQYANRGIVRRTPIMFNPVPIYYAFPKGKVPELVAMIDRHLIMLKEDKDSIYYHSLEKIFGEEKELAIPHWIKWILIVTISLVLLFLIVNVILRRQVKARTSELEEEMSEHKKADEELTLQSEIVENVSEGIYIVGVDDGIIKYTNPTFEKMFGYNQNEMIGKNVSIVNAPTEKTPDEIKNTIMAVLIVTGKWQGEVKNIKKDGTHFWSYANVILFNNSKFGKVIVSVHTDITERKETENKLASHTEELEKINKAFTGRELKMTELKNEIEKLKKNQKS